MTYNSCDIKGTVLLSKKICLIYVMVYRLTYSDFKRKNKNKSNKINDTCYFMNYGYNLDHI